LSKIRGEEKRETDNKLNHFGQRIAEIESTLLSFSKFASKLQYIESILSASSASNASAAAAIDQINATNTTNISV
jgi:hypothetical protein